VEIQGRVAALLELGSGFHPDLTGTENVYINAALLGLSRKQAKTRFEEIIEFSELREFVDEPLRTYSAGMMMRLAFSIAVNLDPDVLVIDEVLGVGDLDFFAKCVERIAAFRRAGKTLLCVSHSLDTLEELCDQGLWLERGKVLKTGSAGSVIKAYRESSPAHLPA
jgi:ABC-type polysaccharide/polyol phosphate transport system ATPase subunit